MKLANFVRYHTDFGQAWDRWSMEFGPCDTSLNWADRGKQNAFWAHAHAMQVMIGEAVL